MIGNSLFVKWMKTLTLSLKNKSPMRNMGNSSLSDTRKIGRWYHMVAICLERGKARFRKPWTKEMKWYYFYLSLSLVQKASMASWGHCHSFQSIFLAIYPSNKCWRERKGKNDQRQVVLDLPSNYILNEITSDHCKYHDQVSIISHLGGCDRLWFILLSTVVFAILWPESSI